MIGLVETNDDGEMETLKGQLMRKQADAEDYHNKYQYLLAEYQNYRKQVERESEIMVRKEIERFLIKLIELRDDYIRAMETVKSGDNQELVNGLESILKNLDLSLKEEGIKEIDAVGKQFDPNIHEAVSFIDNDEYLENTITAEIRKGYMSRRRVVRPSLVEISKKINIKPNEE